ncbi:MAG: cadherin-like beta sandwich domain-containing protein [Clostridia bacterium]|nr:cadherin-like beta sandwich domain-containing protein [Clostridia bacterium]
MKNKKLKIVAFILFIVAILLIGSNASRAASASITASSKDVTVGTKVTIKVSGSAMTWSLKASGSGVSGKIVGGNLSSKANQSFSESYTLDTSSAGTYKVSLSGDVTDANGTTTDISDSVTIKVSAKSSNTTDNTSKTDSTKTTDTEKKSEPTFKSANETVYATGNINIRKSYSADSDKLGSLQTGDKVTRTGIGDNGWSKVTYNGTTGYIKSSLLTTEEPKKSDDKALKSLSIGNFEIDPAFDPEITDYSVAIGNDVEKLDIKAEANSEKAKVEITGNDELKDGNNVVKITVTAEDGTTRIYTITATKQSGKAVALSTLKVNGYTLSPAFSPNITEYKISVADANVNQLDITAITDIENAKVETTGNTNLQNGENVILVKVTSADGSETTTYKIIVTKNATGTAAATTNNKSNNWILYAGIGIILILIIAIIVVIVIARRNAYYDDDEEDDETEDLEDSNENVYSDLYGSSKKNEVKNVDYATDEKEKYTSDSIYGDFSAKANSERSENQATKYEDGFTYNAYNTKDIYENYGESSNGNSISDAYNGISSSIDGFNVSKEEYKNEYSGTKDVEYYSNKVSEMFDSQDNKSDKTSDDDLGYLSQNTEMANSNDEYSTNENNWNTDDYRPRRSKGKHSK